LKTKKVDPTFGRKVQPARERRLPDIMVNQKTSPDAKGIQRMVKRRDTIEVETT
jgi:hypothetical protein